MTVWCLHTQIKGILHPNGSDQRWLMFAVSLVSHHWWRARNVQHFAVAAIGSCWSFPRSPDSSGSQSRARGSGMCCRHCTPPNPPSPPPPLVRRSTEIRSGSLFEIHWSHNNPLKYTKCWAFANIQGADECTTINWPLSPSERWPLGHLYPQWPGDLQSG